MISVYMRRNIFFIYLGPPFSVDVKYAKIKIRNTFWVRVNRKIK